MNSRDDEESKVDSKFNKGKERVKNVALWIVSILFLLFFVLYSKEALVPSIGILIAGFLIMPPINAQIRKHISNKNQGTYTAIKTIMVITLLLVFLSNIPQSESNNLNVPQITDANTIPSIDENSIKENNRLLRVTDYFLKKYLLFLLQIKKIYYIIKLSIDSFTYPERRSY